MAQTMSHYGLGLCPAPSQMSPCDFLEAKAVDKAGKAYKTEEA